MPDETPHPPRFRWLKRIGWLSLAAVVLVVGLRLWAGHVTSSRLDELVEQIRARGEPMHPDEVKRPYVDDVDNGATYLREALAAWPLVDGRYVTEYSWSESEGYDPVDDDAAYLALTKQAIALIRRAKECETCVWPQLVDQVSYTHSQHVQVTLDLALLLKDACHRRFSAQHYAEAIALVDDMLYCANALRLAPADQLSYVVSLGIDRQAANALTVALPSLKLGYGNLASPAARKQVQNLIHTLLDDRDSQKGLHRAFIGERRHAFHLGKRVIDEATNIDALTSGSRPSSLERWKVRFLRPNYERDLLKYTLHATAMIAAAKQATTWPQFTRAPPRDWPERDFVGFGQTAMKWRAPLGSQMYYWVTPTVARTHFWTIAQRRLAATALAIRLYEADHNALPDSLDALVPTYLPYVPRDPFADDSAAIRYKPNGVPSFVLHEGARSSVPTQESTVVVYSIGEDALDDGGVVVRSAQGEFLGLQSSDIVFPVAELASRN